jgi:hypothetical protein
MAVRDEIVWRSGIVYIAIVLMAVALVVRILILQYVQHGKWADMSEKYVYKTTEMPANRGDILQALFLTTQFIWIPVVPECLQTRGQRGLVAYQRVSPVFLVRGLLLAGEK